MQATIAVSTSAGVTAAIATGVAYVAIHYVWPRMAANRYEWGLAFASGVVVGWMVLPTTRVLIPMQSWDRIPFLGLLAAALAGMVRAEGVLRGERWAAKYCVAVLAAWLLVPDWPELTPVWPIQFAVLAVAILTLTVLLTALPPARFGVAFPLWLAAAAAVTCACAIVQTGATIGPAAVTPVGALAGCTIAAALSAGPVDWRGIALPYAVVVGGYAYSAAIFPISPQWPVIAAPAAPIALWLCARGPLARFVGPSSVLIQGACVAVPLVLILLAVLFGGGAPLQ